MNWCLYLLLDLLKSTAVFSVVSILSNAHGVQMILGVWVFTASGRDFCTKGTKNGIEEIFHKKADTSLKT